LIEQNNQIRAQNEVLITYENALDDMVLAGRAHFENGNFFLDQ